MANDAGFAVLGKITRKLLDLLDEGKDPGMNPPRPVGGSPGHRGRHAGGPVGNVSGRKIPRQRKGK